MRRYGFLLAALPGQHDGLETAGAPGRAAPAPISLVSSSAVMDRPEACAASTVAGTAIRNMRRFIGVSFGHSTASSVRTGPQVN